MGLAEEIVLLVFVAFVWAAIVQRLKQPLILGYIIAGVMLGTLKSQIPLSSFPEIQTLAEIGVALLLFSLGLESFLPKLKQVKKISLIGTPIQVLLTMAIGYGIGQIFGWSPLVSLWWGAMISVSSTIVVLKTLTNMGLMGTLSSQVMLGMLIIQDILVIPMMILLPLLSQPSFGWGSLGWALLKAVLFIIFLYFMGSKVFPKILAYVAGWNSRELFMLLIVSLGLGVGSITYWIGLPFAFGAFLAGVVLNDSDYGHQALSEIIPLRDLFALLFFTSIGILVNLSFIWENLGTILLLLLTVLVIKSSLFMAITRAFGYRNIIPLAVGLGLFQVGEFSFVLGHIALSSGVIDNYLYSLVLSISLFSIALTPILSGFSQTIYVWYRKRRPNIALLKEYTPNLGWQSHVVIAGGGRVGQHIGQLLKHLEIDFVIVEINYQRIVECKKAQLPYIYGDISQPLALEATQIDKASLLLITTPALIVAEAVVRLAQKYNPKLYIVARSEGLEQMKRLYEIGVHTVVMPEMEGGLEIAKQAFLKLGLPLQLIQQYSDNIRQHLYQPFYQGPSDAAQSYPSLEDIRNWLEVSWIRVSVTSPIVGKTIKDLNLRNTTGVLVVGIRKNNKLLPSPRGDYVFEANDNIAIVANQDEKQKFLGLSQGLPAALENPSYLL